MPAIGGSFLPVFDSGMGPQLACHPKHTLMFDIGLFPSSNLYYNRLY